MRNTVKITLILLAGILGYYFSVPTREAPPLPPPSEPSKVHCETTKGPLDIMVMPGWSPRGAERFLQLVDDGFFNQLPLFRCVENFVCQVGSVPPRAEKKEYADIPDDIPQPGLRQFKPGYVSFAGAAPNTRSMHIFFSMGSAESLGSQPWETPFAYVSPETVASTLLRFTTKYGDMAPYGPGPDSAKIETEGGAEYLKQNFPDLDYFVSCTREKK